MRNLSSHRASVLIGILLAWGMDVVLAAGLTGQSFEESRRHWAYQPVRRPVPPTVKAVDRVRSPIDAFLLARLEAKGLGFAPPADPRTLLRRLYYDLIGLPPTADEVATFSRSAPGDPRAAIAAVVDRLLADPRYGERWGRHWLDVARYADTKDLVLLYGRDAIRPYAYTYRDYVVRAFNDDIPYDEFIRDQLAADLAGPDLPRWRLGALGFLTLGRLFDNNPHDQIDDQIDTVTRGLLGLTVACARCHDHKYDAIQAADYYGLYGVFASTARPYALPLIEDPAGVPGGAGSEAQLAKARGELEGHIDAEFARLTEVLRGRIGDYLVRAATTAPDLTETAQFGLSLTPDDFRPTLVQRTRRFIAQRAQPDDRVFGPWAVLMALPDAELARPGAVKAVLERKSGRTREKTIGQTCNPLVVDALTRATIADKAGVARAYGGLLLGVYERSKPTKDGTAALDADLRELLEIVTGGQGPVWFARRDTPDHMSRPEKDRFGGLALALDKIAAHATNAPPARAMVVADLPEPYEPRIFVRGSPARPGERVPRGFLRVLNGGREQPFGAGSGRLDLARAITSPTNPLTARVFVNRVWMEHFGEPLVASPSDFGARSTSPSHPELLDWLASEFIRSGWSVKHLHRLMVTSAVFQQSSGNAGTGPDAVAGAGEKGRRGAGVPSAGSISYAPSPPRSPATRESQSLVTSAATSSELDPENKLLWHYPRRRLDLEAMRDTLLFVSGRLDRTLGGRPVDAAGDPADRRRTVYGLVDRQNLPALFRAFDFAMPDQCVERRSRTTVAQQALFAMNSPFIMEQARALAELSVAEAGADPVRRVDALSRRVLGRSATTGETGQALRFIAGAAADPTARQAPWEQFAQVLLASNELVFLD